MHLHRRRHRHIGLSPTSSWILLAVITVACGGLGSRALPTAQFETVALADAGPAVQLNSAWIKTEDAADFGSQIRNALEIESTVPLISPGGPGFIIQAAGRTGAIDAGSGESLGRSELSWDRTPFAGIRVAADTEVDAEPGQIAVSIDLTDDRCRTVTVWDVWTFEPPPNPAQGGLEVLVPTTATLATTLIVQSLICP